MPRSVPLTAATAVVALLGGCTGAAPDGTDSSLGNYAGRTLEVVATWSGAEQANFQAALDEFERRTHATVKYTSGGTDLAVLINSQLAGGKPPDIAFLPQPGVVAELARRGVLKPITGTAADAVRNNYSSAWQALGTVDGQLYGLFFKVANKSVIWYNARAFDDAGVSPPSTWDQLMSVSKTLTEAGITPMATTGADGWVLADWFENAYLRIAGPVRYDELTRHELSWTDPTVVRTLQLLADYWRTPKYIDGGPAGADQLSFTQGIADVFGAKPSAAMIYEGDFVASEIRKLNQVTVGQGARFFPWPAIDGSPPAVEAGGDEGVMFRNTPEANALMTFLASADAARILASRGGFLSANRNLDAASYPDDTTRELAAEVVDSDTLRFGLSDLSPQAFGGGTSADMWVLLQHFLSDNTTAEQVAAQLEAAAARDYGELASRTTTVSAGGGG
jgi:ABC-type glycerol-3-phosphate transport system substrate-binding protein